MQRKQIETTQFVSSDGFQILRLLPYTTNTTALVRPHGNDSF